MPRDVHVHDVIPLLERELGHLVLEEHARGVDEQPGRTELGGHGVAQLGDGVLAAQVAAEAGCARRSRRPRARRRPPRESLQATRKPSRASRAAMAEPMPPAAPVTSATRSRHSCSRIARVSADQRDPRLYRRSGSSSTMPQAARAGALDAVQPGAELGVVGRRQLHLERGGQGDRRRAHLPDAVERARRALADQLAGDLGVHALGREARDRALDDDAFGTRGANGRISSAVASSPVIERDRHLVVARDERVDAGLAHDVPVELGVVDDRRVVGVREHRGLRRDRAVVADEEGGVERSRRGPPSCTAACACPRPARRGRAAARAAGSASGSARR